MVYNLCTFEEQLTKKKTNMFPKSLKADAPVLVIGASGMDVVGRETGNLLPGTSNPSQIRTSFGGVARNVAENLARLGQPVTLLSAVGADQIGDHLITYTAESGVDVSNILHSDQYPTGTYLAVLAQDGTMQFGLDDMRIVTEITPGYIRQHYQLFKEAALVFIDANLPPKTINSILTTAAKTRCVVCGDPTSTSLALRLKNHLDRINILTANSNEAAILIGQPINDTDNEACMSAARTLVSQGIDLAIVTMAEFGLSYASGEYSGYIPAMKTEVVNPTGAGDALIAAVMFALLNEIPEDEAMHLGLAAAALTLRHAGAVVPDLSLEMLYDHLII